MELTNSILKMIADLPTPGYFVVVEFIQTTNKMPQGIELFIQGKLEAIENGVTGRKFKYKEEEWVMMFTFFPTNQVVDERYALKNKVIKTRGSR
ncbi:hypothetical protein D0T50_11805 [Bacteroides sp. 214]|uniref:hypothetical protein n=1 Tax=Bacteroides sp. 214 TaxID=2302935 RepID=UPI0013D0E49D|nr:hypothetical protein [Bacteroides sp. 214]NDW13569.1 hypothetical protein [Bacteroides sp. 214]